MTVVALLLALGVTDMVRWSVGPVSRRRSLLAVVAGASAGYGLVGLGGAPVLSGVVVTVLIAVVLTGWLLLSDAAVGAIEQGGRDNAAARALWLLAVAFAVAVVAVPYVDVPGGVLDDWFQQIVAPGLADRPVQQALAALAAVLFLQSSANRVVRLALLTAGTPPAAGETALRGGRVLGPLERTFVFVIALAGDLTAGAVVIAAKGILRMPEIRNAAQQERGVQDAVTEYFLVGTFTSWLLALGTGFLTTALG